MGRQHVEVGGTGRQREQRGEGQHEEHVKWAASTERLVAWANREGRVRGRSAWAGIKGGWHVCTMLGGLVVGGWWVIACSGMGNVEGRL